MLYPAPLWRRLAAMLYEALIVAAVLLLASLAFLWIVGHLERASPGWRLTGWSRHVFQLYLGCLLGVYFCWFWRRGETLAMRAWGLRLLGRDNQPPSYAAAALRYVSALVLLGPSMASLLWLREHPASIAAWLGLLPGIAALAATQRGADRSALYDRIASTRLVFKPKPTARPLRDP